MSLKDRTPVPSTNGGRRFRIDEILDELDQEDADVLRSWLADVRYSPERILAELVKEGISLSVGAIARYRFEKLGLGERRR